MKKSNKVKQAFKIRISEKQVQSSQNKDYRFLLIATFFILIAGFVVIKLIL